MHCLCHPVQDTFLMALGSLGSIATCRKFMRTIQIFYTRLGCELELESEDALRTFHCLSSTRRHLFPSVMFFFQKGKTYTAPKLTVLLWTGSVKSSICFVHKLACMRASMHQRSSTDTCTATNLLFRSFQAEIITPDLCFVQSSGPGDFLKLLSSHNYDVSEMFPMSAGHHSDLTGFANAWVISM